MEAEYGYGFLGALMAVLGIVIILGLAVAILMIIARWKMFKKAGEEGWKAIIPVYSDMVLCKIAGVWEYYPLVIYGISFAIGFISGMVDSAAGILTTLSYVVTIYYTVILSISVAQSFGKDTTYGVLLIFFSVIMYPMLGFGKAEYVGARPMNDPIMGAIAGKQTTPQPAAQPAAQPGGNFCQQCGSSNPSDSQFCQKCGNKLK